MKIVSLLLRILAILGAGVAIAGWVATKDKVQEAQQQVVAARADANTARQEASDSEQKFKVADSRAKALESDLSDAKSRATSARSQLAEAQRDVSSLRSDINENKTIISGLEAQNTKLKEEIISMRTEVPDPSSTVNAQEYETRITNLNDQISKLKTDLAAAQLASASTTSSDDSGIMGALSGTANQGKDGSKTSTPAPRLGQMDNNAASVLNADVKNGMVIIDRGQKSGLQEQMEFAIAKGYSKPVRVKVAKVAPDYSLAYILPGSEGAKFAAGDEIKLLQ